MAAGSWKIVHGRGHHKFLLAPVLKSLKIMGRKNRYQLNFLGLQFLLVYPGCEAKPPILRKDKTADFENGSKPRLIKLKIATFVSFCKDKRS